MTTPTEEHSEMAREMAQSVSDLVAAAGYPLGMGVGYSERQVGMLTDKFAAALESVERRAIERAAEIATSPDTFQWGVGNDCVAKQIRSLLPSPPGPGT